MGAVYLVSCFPPYRIVSKRIHLLHDLFRGHRRMDSTEPAGIRNQADSVIVGIIDLFSRHFTIYMQAVYLCRAEIATSGGWPACLQC